MTAAVSALLNKVEMTAAIELAQKPKKNKVIQNTKNYEGDIARPTPTYVTLEKIKGPSIRAGISVTMSLVMK